MKVTHVSAMVCCCLSIITGLLLIQVHQGGTQRLTVSFLDVGQGDSILVQAPNGQQILIDGGKDKLVLSRLGSTLPWFDRTIDSIIATHPDADHITGLADVLTTYTVGHVYYNYMQHDTPQISTLERSLSESGHEFESLRAGDVLTLGGGITLHVLYPVHVDDSMETNDTSIVARLTYGDISFLFTGDAPIAVESELVSRYGHALRSTVLKVGHHGSKTSTSDEFLGFVQPRYGILSRGCKNDYGHPHKEVLDALLKFNVAILDTCMEKTITFSTDGSTLVRE